MEEHCGIKITQKMIEAGVAALLPNEVLAPHTEEEIVTKIFLAMLDVAREGSEIQLKMSRPSGGDG